MKTTPYWDKQTLTIYGLLGGYTRLSSQDVSQAVVDFTNQKSNVLRSIKLLAGLEEQRKVRVHHIWLNLRKYKDQLEELPESDGRNDLISKVQDVIDWEVDGHSVLRANILDLMEWEPMLTEELSGCLDFSIEVTAKKWIRGVVQEYLERYRQNDLFTPTDSSYIPYHQQYLALTDYLERSKPQQTLDSWLLRGKIRLLELVYDLVDKGKLVVEGFSTPDFNPMVNTDVTKGMNAQRVDLSQVRVEPSSYDAANGVLTILGEQIRIIKQPNMKGVKKEKLPAQLMRALFRTATFPSAVTFRTIFNVDPRTHRDGKYPSAVVNKASTLAAEINERIQEKLVGIKLVKSDDRTFFIDERYLKK